MTMSCRLSSDLESDIGLGMASHANVVGRSAANLMSVCGIVEDHESADLLTRSTSSQRLNTVSL